MDFLRMDILLGEKRERERERERVSSENRSTVGSCKWLDKKAVETDRDRINSVFLENSIESKGFLEVYMTAEDML
jgi:hypothetical protein